MRKKSAGKPNKTEDDVKVVRCAKKLCRNTLNEDVRAELLAILDMGPTLDGIGIGSYMLLHKLAEDGYPLEGYGILAEEKNGVYRQVWFHNWETDENFYAYIDDEPLRPEVFFGFLDRLGQVIRVHSITEAVAAG